MASRNLQVAIAAVASACGVARAVQRDLGRIRQMTKDDRSPVSVADFAVQAIVALALREALGEAPIVGEEHSGLLRRPEHEALRRAVVDAVGAVRPGLGEDQVMEAIDAGDHAGGAGTYWTLDPIDGTKGFLRGQQYAIALALLERGRVVLGAMGCPNLPQGHGGALDAPDAHGSILAAETGSGARHWPADDTRGPGAAVKAGGGRAGRIRICESVEAEHSHHGDVERVAGRLGLAIDAVRLDSQCKYALVARGQADAYLRMPTRRDYSEKIWDHAAGMVIAAEGGAVVSDIAGRPLDFSRGRELSANRGVICATAAVHDRLIRAVADLGLAAVV
jgi:3'(2'), 5'-bisphosphate nucleotidase